MEGTMRVHRNVTDEVVRPESPLLNLEVLVEMFPNERAAQRL